MSSQPLARPSIVQCPLPPARARRVPRAAILANALWLHQRLDDPVNLPQLLGRPGTEQCVDILTQGLLIGSFTLKLEKSGRRNLESLRKREDRIKG